MPTLDPITRVCLQTKGGKFYSLDWDGTAAITIAPGSGVGVAAHNGTIYALTAADQTGMSPPPPVTNDAPYNPDPGSL